MVQVMLYHFPHSAPSRAALLAARQVGVEVDIQVVDLFKKEQLKLDFIKVNPQHTVPTLIDGDFSLCDSHAIAMYLVNRYATEDTLYPQDPKQRAIVDHRMFFDIGILYARIRDICKPVLFWGETKVHPDKLKALKEALEWVEMFLNQTPWMAGPTLTIADTAILASITSIVSAGCSVSKYPHMCDWLKRCELAVKGWAENNEGAVLFGDEVRAKLEPGQWQ